MAFKTSQQLFGNGSGSPGGTGWVPIDTSAPPTYSANNRGLAFGEQLTSAIANRPHYALALNDDDLNLRLVAFETTGLDAAYRLGAAAVAGGGRVITKNGGAVETTSTLATQYLDDKANAHFRADATADAIDGGGGFDFAARGQAALNSALYGFMDRRNTDLSGNTVLTGDVSVVLNSGGTASDGCTLSAGSWTSGSNTHVALGRDMVEILSGTYKGLYVITGLPTSTRATLRRLDGTAPSFGSNTAATIRFFRPVFGSFSEFGHSGLSFSGVTVMGMPNQTSALEIVPGATLGRFGTNSDGAKYALRVLKRASTGVLTPGFEIDGIGRARSYSNSALLATDSYDAGIDFGASAFFTQQDAVNAYESAFVAKSIGQLNTHYGLAVVTDMRPPAAPTGVLAFTFDNGVVPYNLQLTGSLTPPDYYVTPGITLAEILTPSAQAGIYRIKTRGLNSGRLELTSLGGTTVSLPTSGTGTLRLLYGTIVGRRSLDFTDGFGSTPSLTVAAMTIETPAEDDSSGLVIATSGQNGHYPIRVTSTEDGSTVEVFQVDNIGRVGAREVTVTAGSSGGFYYSSAVARSLEIPLEIGRQHNTNDWLFRSNGDGFNDWRCGANTAYIQFPIQLPTGATITSVQAIVVPANTTASMVISLVRKITNWGTFTAVTSTQTGTGGTASASAAAQLITSTITSPPTVDNTTNTYFVQIRSSSSGTTGDRILAVRVNFTDPGPRNY